MKDKEDKAKNVLHWSNTWSTRDVLWYWTNGNTTQWKLIWTRQI